MGRASGRKSSRMASRSQRLTRLRSTAVLPRRGTIKPTRAIGTVGLRVRTKRCFVRISFPSRCTHRISSLPRSRCARAKRKRALRGGVLGRESYGESFAPLLSAPTQNFPAPTGRHASSKTMLANSPRVARPISGLAHGFLPETALTSLTEGAKRTHLLLWVSTSYEWHIVVSFTTRICALTFPQDVHTFGAPQVFHRANGPRARRSVAPSPRMRAA